MGEETVDSIALLICKIKQGSDSAAEEELWNRYFERLLTVARHHLQSNAKRVKDEEDIALSVINSFFRGAADGRFEQLNDRSDLWQILRLLTKRKVIDYLRNHNAQRRGSGEIRGESVFYHPENSSQGSPDALPGKVTEPIVTAIFAEHVDRLFATLPDPELSQVAMMRLEGYSNLDIAKHLGRSERSVERKLNTIRSIWMQAAKG